MYIGAVLNGKKALDNDYDVVASEEKYEIPTKYPLTNYKGLIDVQAKMKRDIEIVAESSKLDEKGKPIKQKILLKIGDFVVMDYKTSSNVDGGEGFKIQGLFYSWIIWKTKGILPKATIFEYTKIDTKKAYVFTLQDLKDFEVWLDKTLDEIIAKGTKIDNYDLGEWDDVFNGYKTLCANEARRRANSSTIKLKLKNNLLYYNTLDIDKRILDILDKRWTYRCEGCEYSDAFKTKKWDGKKHFLKEKYFPAPFINDFYNVVSDFNEFFNSSIKVELEDLRDQKVINKKYNTVFKESEFTMRYYQEEAQKSVLNTGRIYNAATIRGACAIGKTVVAGSIIREVNNRSLFLVNRKELAIQTKKSFEKQLGVEIGLLMEGQLDVKNQITVATIQTVDAILKRKDATSKQLETYLYNVQTVVFDECHNVTDTGRYGRLSKKLKNASLIVGLSGTPKRRGPDTLELNSLCGFISYSYLKEQAIKDGYICPEKIYFVNHNGCNWGVDYPDSYTNNIVNGELRNTMIADFTNLHKENKKILILTRRIEHAKVLSEKIDGSYIINGTTDKKYREEMYEKFNSNSGTTLIGSVQIFSTGVDIPDLDMVIYCVASKDSNEVIQTIGRIHRIFKDKKFGYYIDFTDVGCQYLEKATKCRKAILKEYNYNYEELEFIDLFRKSL